MGKLASTALATEATQDKPQVKERGFRLRTEMVIKEDVIIPIVEGKGQSIGEMIDSRLADLATYEGEMRNITIDFDEESWADALKMYKAHAGDYFR